VTLCPEEVVKEHLQALQKVTNATWREAPVPDETDEVIDVEAQDVPKVGK
jgi:hypothetical protein